MPVSVFPRFFWFYHVYGRFSVRGQKPLKTTIEKKNLTALVLFWPLTYLPTHGGPQFGFLAAPCSTPAPPQSQLTGQMRSAHQQGSLARSFCRLHLGGRWARAAAPGSGPTSRAAHSIAIEANSAICIPGAVTAPPSPQQPGIFFVRLRVLFTPLQLFTRHNESPPERVSRHGQADQPHHRPSCSLQSGESESFIVIAIFDAD
jgi:hypothetical protein